MNYKETLDFLFSSLPMYHRNGQAAYKANLDNTIALDNHLGNPHKKFRTIHVAGTNGKGSVSHMLAAVLQESGLKTGLYTSPHLKDFRERIRVNGKMIGKHYVSGFITENLDLIRAIQPSFFELCVGMAFQYFADKKADIAVVETGMGGRLDSTNIIRPLVSIITNISLDHMQFLGNTLPLIAAEKAGIIKNRVPVVIGEWHEETEGVFRESALKNESVLMFASRIYRVKDSRRDQDGMQIMTVFHGNEQVYDDLPVDLLGLYQIKNIPTVLQSLDVLKSAGIKISRENIYNALCKVRSITGLRGRWEEIGFDPLIICDTGHNEAGIREVMRQLKQVPFRKLFIVLGMVNDKDPERILPLLPPEAEYFFTKAEIPRALDPVILKRSAEKYKLKGETSLSVKEAVRSAMERASSEDLIFIGGSTFIVAEALPD